MAANSLTENSISCREIPLSQGQVALVDAADYDWLMQWRWWARWKKQTKTFCAYRSVHDFDTKRSHTVLMHRLIMDAPVGILVDHIDGDTLNNRRQNLRLATNSQNMANRKTNSNSIAGLKGVSFFGSKWRAEIQCNNKRYPLGSFSTPEEAHAAYIEAAKRLFGEFARSE